MAAPERPTAASDDLAFHLAPIAFGRVDADGELIYANPAMLDLLDVADPFGRQISSFFGDPFLIDSLLNSALTGTPADTRASILANDRQLTQDVTVWPVAASPTEFAILLRPATSSGDPSTHIRAMVERSPLGMAMFDAAINMQFVNDRWTEITGQATVDALAHGWLDMIDIDGRDDFESALREAIGSGTSVAGRLRVVTKSGAHRWIEVNTTPLEAGPGSGAGLVASFGDVTDSIEAEHRALELTRVLETTPDLVAIFDPSGRHIVWANDAFKRFVPAEELIGARLLPFLDEWSQAHYAASAIPSARRDGNWQGELQFMSRAGLACPVSAMLVAHADTDGRLEAISMVARDLSEIREAEDRVEATELRLAALVEHASDLVAVIEGRGRVAYASPAVSRNLGHRQQDLLGRHILRAIHPDDRRRLADISRQVVTQPGLFPPFEVRVAHTNGGWRHVEVAATNLLENPAVRGVVVNARDITDRVEAAQKLTQRANHDELTGLANRTLLTERLQEALNRAAARRRMVGVLFLDLDRFKVVNDSLGHAAGDQLLCEIARRIESTIRPGDTVARLGGDEFVIVLNDVLRREDATNAAERVRSAVAQVIELDSERTLVTASIGIALSDGLDGPEDLLRDSDTAMYRAKGLGRDRADIFDDRLRNEAALRLSVEQQLRHAIEDDRLEVWYQPVIEIGSQRISGAEALVRLRSEDGELLVPALFIDVAEDSGLINALGAHVLRAACIEAVEWRSGGGDFSIAVNVSARQLADANFPAAVAAVLEETGLPPDRLSLELTESALIDANPLIERVLRELTTLGLHLGLDDFGTGFSSLAYLKRFPIDFVKIDKSFTAGLGRLEHDTAIVKATIALAHSLGLRVVAEGVETDSHLAELTKLGCDWAQGYLFSKPVRSSDFRALLPEPE